MTEAAPRPRAPACESGRPRVLPAAAAAGGGKWLNLLRGLVVLAWPIGALALPADPAPEIRVLNRIAYGPAPGDAERVKRMGIEAYIREQLHPESIAEPRALDGKLSKFEFLDASPAALFARFGPRARKAAKDDEAARKALLLDATRVAAQAQEARLLRAVYSPAQLQEVMTDFWFNHFNVYAGKGVDRIWVGAYERDAIRPYALGRFRDLLGATAKHPAMLFYLDNWLSTAEGFKGPGKSTGLNENYARELMELHTLGVDGGYAQKDVTELARILTGWTYDPRAMLAGGGAGFVFAPRRHDDGAKTFLGQAFPAGHGQDEGERALDLLAESPATAHHLAYQLAQYFVSDAPSPALVERVARRYSETHGDLRETLSALLLSRDFLQAQDRKFKTPYEFVVSALRASNVEINNPRIALRTLRQLGEPLYACQTPDGYRNTQAAWLNSNEMMARINFAALLGAGRLNGRLASPPSSESSAGLEAAFMAMAAGGNLGGNPGENSGAIETEAADRAVAAPLDAAGLQAVLRLPLSGSSEKAIEDAPPRLRAGLVLGSPEFMWR